MPRMNRRKLLASAAFAGLFKAVESPSGAQSGTQSGVNRHSAPSQLRITDMRSVLIA